MNLYLLSQNDNGGYDTYDSCVVLAKDEEQARRIHPQSLGEGYLVPEDYFCDKGTWAAHPNNVEVVYLGKAGVTLGNEPKVLCASFNAG